jgi:hypothetical protein
MCSFVRDCVETLLNIDPSQCCEEVILAATISISSHFRVVFSKTIDRPFSTATVRQKRAFSTFSKNLGSVT